MAKIPDFTDLPGRATPQPGSAVAGYQPVDEGALNASAAVTVNQGQAVVQAGAQLGDVFNQKVKEERIRFDQTRAEDAWNQLKSWQLDATYGDKGFTKIKGGDAVNGTMLTDYGQRFEQQVNQITEKLGNDDQKRLFMSRAQVSAVSMKEDLLRHVATQNAEYQTQTYNGTLKLAEKFATTKWNEPGAIEATLLDVKNAVESRGKALGWSSEYTKAMLTQEQGNVNKMVIGQMIVNKEFVKAKEWFDGHKDTIDAETSKALGGALYKAQQHDLFNGYTSAYLTVRDDAKGLRALDKAIAADPKLDDEFKNQLMLRNASAIDRIQRTEDARAQRAATKAASLAATFATMSTSPYGMTESQRTLAIQTGMTNPELAPVIKEALAQDDALRQFRYASPAEQTQAMNNWTAAANQGKVSDRFIAAARTVQEQQNRERKDDPYGFEVRMGNISPSDASTKTIDLNPASKAATDPNLLAQRLRDSQWAAQKNNAEWKPLTPAEVDATKTLFQKSDASGRSALLSHIYNIAGDPKGFMAIVQQVARDEPAMGVAASIGYRDIKNADGKRVSETILRGLDILHPERSTDGKPSKGTLLPQPPEKKMLDEFSRYASEAFAVSPKEFNARFQAAQAYYAGAMAGKRVTDPTILEPSVWQEAMKMATGGVTRYNSLDTVKPWGLTDSEFQDQLAMRQRDLAASGKLAAGLTPGQIVGLPVVPVGTSGRYAMKTDNGLLRDAKGNTVVIDLNEPMPVRVPAGVDPAVAAGKAGPKRPRGLTAQP